MLEAAAYESGNRTLGLELGKEFRISALGPITHLMQTAPNRGRCSEELQPLLRERSDRRVSVLLGERWHHATVLLDPGSAIRFREQDADLTLAIEIDAGDVFGPAWQASGVEFEHPPARFAVLPAAFRMPIAVRQTRNSLLFPARFLDVSLKRHECEPACATRSPMAIRSGNGLCGSISCAVSRPGSRPRCAGPPRPISRWSPRFRHEHQVIPAQARRYGVNYLDIRNRVTVACRQMMLAGTSIPVTSIALAAWIQRDQRVFPRFQDPGRRDAR